MLTINYKLENDYELLYLIDNDNEEALEMIFNKYHNLIISLIKKYNFTKDYEEDVYQEARIVLFKAIKTYDVTYSKTFTMYFKKLLENRFNSLIVQKHYKMNNEILKDELLIVSNSLECDKFVDVKRLSNVEKAVYFQYFNMGNSIEKVSKSLNLTKKQAYNAICRIKKKLQKQKYK